MYEILDEMADSLTFTKISRREAEPGTWVLGTIAGHKFNALVFPEHAESETYELGTSRISKLWVQRLSEQKTVVNFDWGWDVQPVDDLANWITDFLATELADHVFGK